jgi:hypothetical protein
MLPDEMTYPVTPYTERKESKMSQPSLNLKPARAEKRVQKQLSIREEARAAILAEQFSYLLGHIGSCPEDCPDCARLARVETILLQPFDFRDLRPFGIPGSRNGEPDASG